MSLLEFYSIENLEEQIDRLFDQKKLYHPNGAYKEMPFISLKEDSDKYTVLADIPDNQPENLRVTIENGLLTIQFRRNRLLLDNYGYLNTDDNDDFINRKFKLRSRIDKDAIEINDRGGKLEITIPKLEKANLLYNERKL